MGRGVWDGSGSKRKNLRADAMELYHPLGARVRSDTVPVSQKVFVWCSRAAVRLWIVCRLACGVIHSPPTAHYYNHNDSLEECVRGAAETGELQMSSSSICSVTAMVTAKPRSTTFVACTSQRASLQNDRVIKK